MAYPYKKMTSQDCDYIRSVTAPDRVWVGVLLHSGLLFPEKLC